MLIRERSPIKGNVRFRMINDYINEAKMSFNGLFFGYNLMSIPSIAYYNGNPHNSFIFAHANYGLVFIFLLLFFGIKFIKKSYRDKKILIVLLGALCLRSFSDITAFPSYYDSLFYLLIFEYNLDKMQYKQN
jgi:GT2 family glycosyltransferase